VPLLGWRKGRGWRLDRLLSAGEAPPRRVRLAGVRRAL